MMIANRERLRSLQAQLSTLEGTLDRIPPSDRINRMSVEQDIKRIRNELYKLKDESFSKDPSEDTFLSLAFSGDPVIAQRGIDIEFAGKIIQGIQGLVSSIVASRQGSNANKGPIKDREKSTLHITGIVRGSFGFVIEPIARQMDMFEAETSRALNSAAQMLVSISDPFVDLDNDPVLADASDRVLENLSKMIDHLSTSNATLSLSTPSISHVIAEREISISRKKLDVTQVEEKIVKKVGILNGILPESHRFELNVDGEIITGPVARMIPTSNLQDWNASAAGKKVTLKLRERILIRKGEVVRTTYLLLELD